MNSALQLDPPVEKPLALPSPPADDRLVLFSMPSESVKTQAQTFRPTDESMLAALGSERQAALEKADAVEWLELYPWGAPHINRLNGHQEYAFRVSDIVRVAQALLEILEAADAPALTARDERRDITTIANYLADEHQAFMERVRRQE